MRNTFGNWFAFNTIPNKDLLISGDIGFGVFDDLKAKRPDDFINFGIAEQNMIGVSVGLSRRGFNPWIYTIIPFLVFRPLEFIRNLICYDFANVKLVGIGGGLTYDNLGYTHFAVEDISVLSQFSNLRILTPYTPANVVKCCIIANDVVGPLYLRLGKGGEVDFVPHILFSGADFFKSEKSKGLVVTYGNYANYILKSCILDQRSFDLLVVYDVDSLDINELKLILHSNLYFVEEQNGSGFYKLHDFLHKNSIVYNKLNLNNINYAAIGSTTPVRDSILAKAGIDYRSINLIFNNSD